MDNKLSKVEIDKLEGSLQKISSFLETTVQKYRQDRSNVFSASQIQLLELMQAKISDPESRDKIPLRDIMAAIKVMYEMERLEGGQTTANVGLISVIERADQIYNAKATVVEGEIIE